MLKKKTENLSKEERITKKRNELAKKEKVAAIWTRVSSADQYMNNYSIPTQIGACEEYCIRISGEGMSRHQRQENSSLI